MPSPRLLDLVSGSTSALDSIVDIGGPTYEQRLRLNCRHSLATFASSSSKVRQNPLARLVANWLSDGPALRLIGQFDIGGRLHESEPQEISPISRPSFGLYFQSR